VVRCGLLRGGSTLYRGRGRAPEMNVRAVNGRRNGGE
jgi:hypothetical protein